ncbi:MAG: hypothetical protein HY889_09370 [Deltaproteobacteria bacterium]|nr:hypothetical protein [Deltaproteobacteria bacterium]
MNAFWKKNIFIGIPVGIVWGWISMGLNALSGAFEFEGSFIHDFITFSIGGAIFGVIVAGFLSLVGERLPFKRHFPKAVLLSTSLWLLLRFGGVLLSAMEPERYHIVTPQTIQGFVLSLILGGLIGIAWKKEFFV